MTYLHPVAAVPNNLITDTALSYTTKRVALVLLLLAGRKGRYVTVSFAALARLCKYSTTTAQKAVKELCTQGYLLKSNRYHFGQKQNRLIYSSNCYLWLRREGGYTLISRDILAYNLTPAAFGNLLYLYRCAARSGRAFPSIHRIAKHLDMAKSTVGAALNVLRTIQAIVRHHCISRRHSYSCNSYYPTDHVFSRRELSTCEGSPNSDKLSIINQITKDLTLREEKYGSTQFDCLPSPFADFPFYHDGMGVRVSFCDELELSV